MLLILGEIQTGNKIFISSIKHFNVQNQHYLGYTGDSKLLELRQTSYDRDRNLIIGNSIFIRVALNNNLP